MKENPDIQLVTELEAEANEIRTQLQDLVIAIGHLRNRLGSLVVFLRTGRTLPGLER